MIFNLPLSDGMVQKMKLYIKETGTIKTLEIIDPKTGCNYISDFIGKIPESEHKLEKAGRDDVDYEISQDDYEWLADIVRHHQALNIRIRELEEKHDYNAIYDLIISL